MTGRGLPDTEAQLAKKTLVRKLVSILGFGAMLVPLGYVSEARADTNQICTFQSVTPGINFSEGVTHDNLRFSWNNTTGTLLSATWLHAGDTITLDPAIPGTMEPGFDPTVSILTSRHFHFNLVIPGYPTGGYEMEGAITNRIAPGDTTFSGTYFGTSTAWVGGYGNVTCVNQ